MLLEGEHEVPSCGKHWVLLGELEGIHKAFCLMSFDWFPLLWWFVRLLCFLGACES